MKKDKEVKNFSHYLNEIERQSGYLIVFPDDSVSKAGESIKKDILELRSGLKGMKITLIVSAIFTFVMFFITAMSISNYNVFKTKSQKDFEAARDSVLSISKSGNKMTYYEDTNGKIISYQDLYKENRVLQDSLNDSKFFLNYAVRTYGITFDENKEGENYVYGIESKVLNECYNDQIKALQSSLKMGKTAEKAMKQSSTIVDNELKRLKSGQQ
jgi:hypothetical protein